MFTPLIYISGASPMAESVAKAFGHVVTEMSHQLSKSDPAKHSKTDNDCNNTKTS